MGVSVNVDITKAQRTLSALGIKLSKHQVNTALARTINRTLSTGRTQASRDIRSEYRIKKRALDNKLKIFKASKASLHGRINAHGVPLSLANFNPIQRKTGTTVNIKGKRKLIKHAFISTMPNGGYGVFMRAGKGYKAGGIEYKPGGRLPITKLVTLSEGAVFANPDVIEKTEAKVESTFASRFDHELNNLLKI